MNLKYKFNILKSLAIAVVASCAISCDETSEIGSSIVEDQVEVVVDSVFTVSGYSIPNNTRYARTSNQLLGAIDAAGYGSLSSDFVAQFMPANKLDTVGITADNVDSLKLRMFMSEGAYVGDTLAPMGLEVYRLKKQLPNTIAEFTNPADYYDPQSLLAKKTYTASVVGLSDSIAEIYTSQAVRVVDVKLPLELGREFFNKYKSPGGAALFNDPQSFADWFPGIYVKNSYGAGRIMTFYATRMYMYLSKQDKIDDTDTTLYYVSSFMAVTPEVINYNNINQSISSDIKQMAQESPVVVAPSPQGYDVSVTLPVRDIVAKYKEQAGKYNVMNAMTFKLAVDPIENDYGITPPGYMLLVKKDKRDEFFNNADLPNNKTSFYAAYSSASKTYTFSSMRQYVLDMIEKEATEGLDDSDGEFILMPVTVVTETVSSTTSVLAIVPYTETPVMAKFNWDNSQIRVIYSKQTIKN
ncbi:MAG: DUF4270 domain-containing protein [Muribaculum sp.]|nr:DUF4270 domain-containing protein [Muribaculaceae bacterium]MCM1080559.1 DUF4270 domain-containing protein [Muribaculum sp.]